MKSTSTFRSLSLTLAFALIASLMVAGVMPSLTQEASAKAFREAPQGQQTEQQLGPNTIAIPQGAGDRDVPGDRYYQPVNATISTGSTVTWINQDTLPHTSTSGDPQTGPSGEFDTGFISTGQSASVTITSEAGTTIPYYCTIHPWMVATIDVVAAGQQVPPTQQQQMQQPANDTQVANATQQPQQTLNQITQSLQQAVQSLQQAIDTLEHLTGGNATITAAGNETTQTQQQQQPMMGGMAGQQQPPANNVTQQNVTETAQQQQAFVETSPTQYDEYLAQNEPPEPEVRTEFPGMEPKINQTLPSVTDTETGFEQEHENNWITANHDIYGTRWSNQTIINKDNVDQLEVKWQYVHNQNIEGPPIVINDTIYAQDNNGLIMAFDANTGLMKWKINTGEGGLMHGLTYDNGVIFAGTGHNGTVIAVNPENGEIFWESAVLGPTEIGFNLPMVPLVWQDTVIAGSAGGDLPTHPGVVQGNITGLDRKTGEILWSIKLTAGEWVTPDKIPPNGGGTAWSTFSFDPETGLLYAPTGNATPDFNAITRIDWPNWYTNHVVAVNITNGQMEWATPFIAAGTVFEDVALPDTHDWDVSFGTTFSKIMMDNGTEKKIVIGHDKMGNIMAMDAETGDELWWDTLGTIYRPNAVPRPPPEGSGLVFPGPAHGIENWHAVDNDTIYVATTSMGYNYFTEGLSGYAEPVINSTESGYGNGTVWALDLLTGDVKWQYDVDFPTKTSALVTNDVVFAGHMTPIGTPYEAGTFGNPSSSPLFSSGIIVALDKQTGDKLWEFNVGEPIGIGGPSIGNGMLFVPTGTIHAPSEVGSITAFGLPEDDGATQAANATEQQQEDEEQQRQPPSTSEEDMQEGKAIQMSAVEDNETYRWSVEGETNPTITLVANANNTITVDNPTDEVHELIIETTQGEQVAATEDIQPGGSGELTIEPDTTMGSLQYYCEYHPETMRGDVRVTSSPVPGDGNDMQ